MHMCAGTVAVCACVHTCGHCVPLQPVLPRGVGACGVGGLCHGSELRRGDVSVPNGSFTPQENSDVFLSAVDTDWKVGAATGGAPPTGSCVGQQPVAGEGCGVLSGSRGVAVPHLPWGRSAWWVSVRGTARPLWSLAGGDRGVLPDMLCAGTWMWLAGTW